MKISNYEITQAANAQYNKSQTRVINTQLFKVRQRPLNSIDFKDYLQLSVDERPLTKEEVLANIQLVESFITFLTRKQFKFQKSQNVQKLRKRTGRNYALRISLCNEVHEQEKMVFSSKGTIKTTDGKSIDFSCSLNMSREYYEKNSMVVQSGKMLDPLVINLDNKGVNFGNKKIHIDLDLDGHIDTFNMLNHGSGLLALDKNGNGKVDDGSELFGPETDDGFGELSCYDKDGNDWIDENDAIFNSLKIWTIDKDGNEELIGIKEAGIGAIYLGKVSNSFDFKTDNDLVARLTGSSIYLRENGKPGMIHEVKLNV